MEKRAQATGYSVHASTTRSPLLDKTGPRWKRCRSIPIDIHTFCTFMDMTPNGESLVSAKGSIHGRFRLEVCTMHPSPVVLLVGLCRRHSSGVAHCVVFTTPEAGDLPYFMSNPLVMHFVGIPCHLSTGDRTAPCRREAAIMGIIDEMMIFQVVRWFSYTCNAMEWSDKRSGIPVTFTSIWYSIFAPLHLSGAVRQAVYTFPSHSRMSYP